MEWGKCLNAAGSFLTRMIALAAELAKSHVKMKTRPRRGLTGGGWINLRKASSYPSPAIIATALSVSGSALSAPSRNGRTEWSKLTKTFATAASFVYQPALMAPPNLMSKPGK